MPEMHNLLRCRAEGDQHQHPQLSDCSAPSKTHHRPLQRDHGESSGHRSLPETVLTPGTVPGPCYAVWSSDP